MICLFTLTTHRTNYCNHTAGVPNGIVQLARHVRQIFEKRRANEIDMKNAKQCVTFVGEQRQAETAFIKLQLHHNGMQPTNARGTKLCSGCSHLAWKKWMTTIAKAYIKVNKGSEALFLFRSIPSTEISKAHYCVYILRVHTVCTVACGFMSFCETINSVLCSEVKTTSHAQPWFITTIHHRVSSPHCRPVSQYTCKAKYIIAFTINTKSSKNSKWFASDLKRGTNHQQDCRLTVVYIYR